MFWDRVAGVYDLFVNVVNRKTHQALRRIVADLIQPEDRVLECACGTGLLTEVIAGLGRVLPKPRVLRGFGALTAGGALGIPVALYGWISKAAGNRPVWMLAGAVLCALFAGLCWKRYKRKEEYFLQ